MMTEWKPMPTIWRVPDELWDKVKPSFKCTTPCCKGPCNRDENHGHSPVT